AAILARRLGPDGFGVVGFATAICGYLLIAINSGLHDIGTREVARTPDRAVAIYSSVATTRLLLAILGVLLLAGLSSLLPKPVSTKLVVLLSGLSFFSFAIDPSWVFKGMERPLLAGFGQVLGQAVYAVGVVVAIWSTRDVIFVPVVQFGGE